jgi:hypothetical protein
VSQGTVGQNVTAFSQPGLALGTRYCYRIVATGSVGDAAPSSEAWGTPDAPLSAKGVTIIFAP